MEEFITVCPRNCYSTCSFKVQVENNRIRRILPFSENSATPEGPCIKGLSYIERAHSPDRIIHPLIKNTKGEFNRATRNEAFDYICEKLSALKTKYGPHSLMWYRGSGNSGLINETGTSFWKAFGGVTTTYGNLCWPAGLEAVRLTLGSVKHNVPWDLQNARTIIIWGKNPAETNIQEMAFIASARDKGARIIVIDLRRTPTADKADLLICPGPGTDGAIALAACRVIIDEGLADNEFIRKNVSGFNEFTDSLKITPGDAGKISSVPAEAITDFAREIARGGPVTFLPGYGLQRHSNGGQTIRSILALAVVTGNIGKTGAGFNFANLQGYVFDNLKEPLTYYPDPVHDKPFRRTLSMTRLGIDMMQQSEPQLKAAWIERGNPVLQSPDSGNVTEAFSRLEFKVVVDQFMTDTAAMADVILPAKDMFEQPDIISSYWSPYIQYKPGILQPEGDIIPESEIYYNLAKRLDLSIDKRLLPEPGNENTEEWLEERIKGYTGLSLADLKKGPVLAPGLQAIAYQDLKFETPSGRIELMSSEARMKWGVPELPEYGSLIRGDEQKEYPLSFITPNTGSRIHSQFGNLKIIKSTVPPPALEMAPSDASERKIRSGDKVRIFNRSGEICTTALVSDKVPPGLAVLPNGIWLNEGGGGNMLTGPVETDMGFGAAFHDAKVEVEKVVL